MSWLFKTLSISIVAAIIISARATAQPSLAQCFLAAAHRYSLNPLLLYSIACHESQMSTAASNLNEDGSIDLGIMQINSRWLPVLAAHGISRDMLLNPCTNVSVGAWILASEFYRHGASWSSVGRYNSPDAKVGADYAEEVRLIFSRAQNGSRIRTQP